MLGLTHKIGSVIIPVVGAAGLCLVTACEPPPEEPGQLPGAENEQTEESAPSLPQPEEEEQGQEEMGW